MNIDEDRFRQILREELSQEITHRQLASKNDMRGMLQDFATKDDVQEMLQDFATKDDLELEFAKSFGKITRHFDARFDNYEVKTDARINGLYNMLDGFVGRMDTDEVERAALSNQVDRQGRWIDELAGHAKVELSPP